MNITFQIDQTFNATVRKQAFAIDVAKVADASHAEIYGYGLQRLANDAAGRAGKRDARVDAKGEFVKKGEPGWTNSKEVYATDKEYLDACLAYAAQARDKMYSGDWSQTRTTAEPRDSVKAEAINIIGKMVTAAKVPTLLAVKDLKARNAKLGEMVLTIFAKDEAKWRAKATAAIAERAALAESIDLSAFMG